MPRIAWPTYPGSTGTRGSSSVQIAVVSVRPYACKTGMPSIRKNCCVSGASGAEPQMSARRCGEITGRVMEDAIGLAVLAHELVEALCGAGKHVGQVAGAEANTLRFARSAGGVDDGDEVSIRARIGSVRNRLSEHGLLL